MTAEMRHDTAHFAHENSPVPNRGDRIELLHPRMGVLPRGTVFHVDQVQILVKWDDGRSESLRPGIDRFRIIEGP
jgi:Domain of unknown function (DUF4314)